MSKRKISEMMRQPETTNSLEKTFKSTSINKNYISSIYTKNQNDNPEFRINYKKIEIGTQTDDPEKYAHKVVKPFFKEPGESVTRQTDYNKKIVYDMISEFNNELQKYKAFLTNAQIVELNEHGNQKCKITYSRENLTAEIEELIYQSLYAKDNCNISDFNYNLFRKILNLPIAKLYQVIAYRRELDAKFALHENPHGWYLDPMKKIVFVLKYFIPNNQIAPGELIKIKLVGDGANLNKKHTNLFNFAFTIINEVERNKSCWGNYILGN
jgi:hypothetical protein